MANPASDTGDGRTNPVPTGRGCMLCRLDVKVENFSDLRPGDQICMPGRVPIFGRLYEHHAVVASIDISADGETAKLMVFDVDEKGKYSMLCPCNRKPYPIKEHCLYNKEEHKLASPKCMTIKAPEGVSLKKVVYRKRKFDLQGTVRRARLSYEHDQSDIKYCFCSQNCEHFACACINGPDVIQKALDQSISIQALDFVWIFISIIFWAFQAIFYGFNFWMHAVFVRKDPDFEFLSSNHDFRDFLNRNCYAGESSRRFFQTTCDWKMMGVFIAFFSFLFLLIVLCYYVPLYRKKLMCAQCFTTVCINLFFSRLLAFVVVETFNILLETPLYMLVTSWRLSRVTTVLMLILVSAGGAILIYSLASVITKAIVWVCGKCSQRMMGFHDFVPFRGIMWCLCKMRCCWRNAKNKYLADDIEMESI